MKKIPDVLIILGFGIFLIPFALGALSYLFSSEVLGGYAIISSFLVGTVAFPIFGIGLIFKIFVMLFDNFKK